MKLRNKKTGETGYYLHTHRDSKTGVLKVAVLKDGVPFSEFKPHEPIYDYETLEGLSQDWEDAPEEPKEYWFIDTYSYEVSYLEERRNEDLDNFNKEIGNYFETREEAEKAVERLRAWKRLKDKGFRFNKWYFHDILGGDVVIIANFKNNEENDEDLDVLFGGEE